MNDLPETGTGRMFKTLSKEQMPVDELQTKPLDESFMEFAKYLWDIMDKTILEAVANGKLKGLEECMVEFRDCMDGLPEPRLRVAWLRFIQPEWMKPLPERQQLQLFLLTCSRVLANTFSDNIRQMIRFYLDPLSPPRLVRQTAVSADNLDIAPMTEQESRDLSYPKILPSFKVEPYELDERRDTPLMNAWKRIWFNYDHILTQVYYDMISFLGMTKMHVDNHDSTFPATLHSMFSLLGDDYLDTEKGRAQLLRAADAAAGWLKNAPCCLPAGILHCSDTL